LDLDVDYLQKPYPKTLGVHPDPKEAIHCALRNLTGTVSLRSLASPNNPMAIILDWYPGITNTVQLVDAVSEALASRDMLGGDVKYIVSSSAGRALSEQLLSEINECQNLQSSEVLLHNPDRVERHVKIGVSPSIGNEILVDETVVESELVVSVSSVMQDSFAGATGGRMAILPGVSHRQTIDCNKAQQGIEDTQPFLLHTKSCRDMIEASQMAGLMLSVNLVHDRLGNLASVQAGEPEESWLQSVDEAKQLALTEYTNTCDVVFVSAGGYPFDSTLYHAIDALFAASSICRRNGVIVLIAECSDGVGPNGFSEGVSQSRSQSDALVRIQTDYREGMEKSRYFWRVLEKHRLVLCSRLRRSQVEERLYADAVKDPQEAMEIVKNYVGLRPRVALIEYGRMTYPICRHEES
jgi:nickel-dependent lactate racemase